VRCDGYHRKLINPDAQREGYLNDLWKYAVSSGLWTWMGGSNITLNQFGVTGQVGVADVTSRPGARSAAMAWCDGRSRELWIFGGTGYTSTGGGAIGMFRLNSNSISDLLAILL
jgi:hypothetical protein